MKYTAPASVAPGPSSEGMISAASADNTKAAPVSRYSNATTSPSLTACASRIAFCAASTTWGVIANPREPNSHSRRVSSTALLPPAAGYTAQFRVRNSHLFLSWPQTLVQTGFEEIGPASWQGTSDVRACAPHNSPLRRYGGLILA